MTGARPIVVNADDYGLNAGVDRAILTLAERGVVTSTSVMTLSPRWTGASRLLANAPLDRGLHLDLTSSFCALPCRLGSLMAAAWTGRLNRAAVRGAIDEQLGRFEAALGAPPDFVDGHQHVHQLPGIRQELVAALDARYGSGATKVRLRSCWSARWRGVKAAIIAAAGSRGLMKLARAHGHACNSDFVGVYDFSLTADLPALWRGWLEGAVGAPQRGMPLSMPLAMCHVGVDGQPPDDDPIWKARVREFEWLSSPRFCQLCAELGVTLCRAPR